MYKRQIPTSVSGPRIPCCSTHARKALPSAKNSISFCPIVAANTMEKITNPMRDIRLTIRLRRRYAASSACWTGFSGLSLEWENEVLQQSGPSFVILIRPLHFLILRAILQVKSYKSTHEFLKEILHVERLQRYFECKEGKKWSIHFRMRMTINGITRCV